MLRCLVTGATGGGIGEATAHDLARRGLQVCVHGRHADRVHAVLDALPRAQGQEHAALVLDLSGAAAILPAVAELQTRWGGVDVLVSNAAPSLPAAPLHELDESQWRIELQEILEVPLRLAKAVLPGMMARGLGRLVFLSSSAAQRGSLGRSAAYAAAKAGLLGLARQIALEYAAHGVTANAIAPSQVDTPRVRAGGRRTSESLAEFGRRAVPLGRVGDVRDVVQAVSFLIDCEYITGQLLVVDGGSSLASPWTRSLP